MELEKHVNESDRTSGLKVWKNDLMVVGILSLVTALLVLIPDLAGIGEEESFYFYLRYLPLILFNGLIIYTIWQKSGLNRRTVTGYGLVLMVLTTLASLLPGHESDSSVIALIHVPLFLWCLFGLAYVG
ncbi:MAG: hypothetical protein R6V75_07285, partial [Bacteroidales bacterium]